MGIALPEPPPDLRSEAGLELYLVTDTSHEAYERAAQRMVQAAARPITALTYLLERQRD
jgi:hypothetical protein